MNQHLSPESLRLPLHQEDQARADVYALLARLLLRSPDGALLGSLASASDADAAGDGPGLGHAWRTLCALSATVRLETVQAEFDDLFVSTSDPRLNPYASLYMAGFINEKPLAALRTELARLTLGRKTGSTELEDHLGALCETMRLLIEGNMGSGRQPLQVQRRFFEAHIGSWYQRCLDDIRDDPGACYYRAVAELAAAFLTLEADTFGSHDDGMFDTVEMGESWINPTTRRST